MKITFMIPKGKTYLLNQTVYIYFPTFLTFLERSQEKSTLTFHWGEIKYIKSKAGTKLLQSSLNCGRKKRK